MLPRGTGRAILGTGTPYWLIIENWMRAGPSCRAAVVVTSSAMMCITVVGGSLPNWG